MRIHNERKFPQGQSSIVARMAAHSAKHLTFMVGSMLTLLGCALLHPQDVPAQAATSAISQEQIEKRVTTLLSRAEDAMVEHRYLLPDDDNAYALYHEVLALQPDNDQAVRGLERIVEAYLELAVRAFDAHQMGEVYSNLALARRVDPKHPSIATVERRLEFLNSSRRDVYSLERDTLAARKASVRHQLQRIGFEAKTRDALCLITARSDSEGRWIYQQLDDSPGDKRVRARIQIGTPPSIELRYMPHAPSL